MLSFSILQKRFFLLLALFSISVTFNLSAQTDVCEDTIESEDKKYDVMNMNEIPIGMWVTPPDEFRNDKQYERIANAGINFVNGFGTYENNTVKIKTVLDLCAKYSLKYFVNNYNAHQAIVSYAKNQDKAIVNSLMDNVRDYAEHPAYAGELLFDEPGKPLFLPIKSFTKKYEKLYPSKMWHINLFPSYAIGGIKTTSYEDYITSWLDIINPKHLSYDSYPLLETGGIIQDYFYNLDLIRAKTLEKGIPFWTFIQTLSIAQTPGVPNKRDPSEEEIRWQVWTNLIFGAKGIQYFCYWSPGSNTEVFSDALITREGEKTDKYNYVKHINSDIKKIGKILLNCDAMGVIQTTTNPYPLYEGKRKRFGPLKKVCGDENIIGCFTDKNGQYFILISSLAPNNDATVKLLLKQNREYVTIIKEEKEELLKIKNQELTLTISAGDAVLIKL